MLCHLMSCYVMLCYVPFCCLFSARPGFSTTSLTSTGRPDTHFSEDTDTTRQQQSSHHHSSSSSFFSATPLFASVVYKQSHIRKHWNERYMYVTELGLLVHKGSEDQKRIDGKLMLCDCDWFRTVVSVKASDMTLSKGDAAGD